jgi:hypothetical protein
MLRTNRTLGAPRYKRIDEAEVIQARVNAVLDAAHQEAPVNFGLQHRHKLLQKMCAVLNDEGLLCAVADMSGIAVRYGGAYAWPISQGTCAMPGPI